MADVSPPEGLPPIVGRFANHHRKFLRVLHQSLPTLRARLADGPVQLDGPCEDPVLELFQVRRSLADVPKKAVERGMAAWYAWRFLQLNAATVARLESATAAGRMDRFRNGIDHIERSFRALSRAFLRHLVDHHAGGRALPPFALAFVGALSDHEDIDIAIIAEEDPGEWFTRLLGRVQTSSFRYGHVLHPHLSRFIPGTRIWATVPEYKALLDRDLKNVVLVSQVLGAGLLVGERSLFARFRAEVHDRYLAGSNPGRHHEGFVRGGLGELRYLVSAEHDPTEHDPKQEVYRLVKLMVAVLRTMFDVERHGVVRALGSIAELDPERSEPYGRLVRVYAFNEVLRFLYALFVVQDEPIPAQDAALRPELDRIARLMGRSDGAALLDEYAAQRQEAVEATRALLGLVEGHLRDISHLRRVHAAGRLEATEAPARALLRTVRRFSGRVFRDDLVDLLLEAPGLLPAVASDLATLGPTARASLIEEYLDLLAVDLPSLVRLLAALGRRAARSSPEERALSVELFERFVDALSGSRQLFDGYVELCYADARLTWELLGAWPDHSASLLRCLGQAAEDPRVHGALHRHRALYALATGHSRYVGRFVDQMVDAHPHLIEVVHDLSRARDMARRLLAGERRTTDATQRLRVVGEYYDLGFVRSAVHTLLGTDATTVEREFLAFSDLWIKTLVGSVAGRVFGVAPPGDALAALADFGLFATGGNARGEAFYDDYDYVAVADTDDAEHLARCERVVAAAHGGILKRALVPHNRLVETFGRYVVTLDELESFLSEDRDDLFIDQSEVLGCRLVAGDPSLAWRLSKRVVAPLVFGRRETYLRRMVTDFAARRTTPRAGLHPKEGPGGLRDMVLLLLVLQARHGVREPLTLFAFDRLAARIPDARTVALLGDLEERYRFVKRIRDLYRLAVAYDEEVDPDQLAQLLDTTAASDLAGGPAELAARIRTEMATAGGLVTEILVREGLLAE